MESIPIRKFLREHTFYLKSLPVQITKFGQPVAIIFPYEDTSNSATVQGVRERVSGSDRTSVSRDVQSKNIGELEGFHE